MPETIADGTQGKNEKKERCSGRMNKMGKLKSKKNKSQCCIKLLFGQVIDTLSQWELPQWQWQWQGG